MEPTSDYRDIEGLREFVQQAGQRAREELQPHGVTSHVAKGLAVALLEVRLQVIGKDGVPDLKSDANATKTAQVDAVWYATEGRGADREATRTKLRQAIRNQMSDVLRKYVRSLDTRGEEYARRFAPIQERHPDMSPSEAVFTFYGLAAMSKREVMVQRSRDARGG